MMAKRLLSYPLLAAVLLLAALIPANAAFAEWPDTCAPEERAIPGNTNSPCKYDFQLGNITGVSYSVQEVEGANSCREVLSFTGASDWSDFQEYNSQFPVGQYSAGYQNAVQAYFGWVRDDGDVGFYWPIDGKAVHPYAIHSRRPVTLNHAIGQHSAFVWRSGNPIDLSNVSGLRIVVTNSDANIGGNRRVSYLEGAQFAVLPVPRELNDYNGLMNACLAGIKQRLENEAKLEETRQRVGAERVAQERAAKQAEAEAERQRLETEAAREALRLVRETELAKTQALIEQLEREKIIIGIWQEIVVEKQKGAEARAQITNRYLTDIEANAAEFKASVVAKAEEIRRLQEINAAITDAIIAHNDEVERQLEIQATREAEQREKLDDLHIEPPETDTPALTPTATP